jgi:hypothetical protein
MAKNKKPDHAKEAQPGKRVTSLAAFLGGHPRARKL